MLCGGLGTRLRGATGNTLPKALAPVAGRPFLAYLLDALARDGMSDVLLLTGWGADQVRRAIGDGSEFGLCISYSEEPRPLGTGGAVLLARQRGHLADTFLLTNGDTLLQEGYIAVVREHARLTRDYGLAATLVGVVMPANDRFDHLEVVSVGTNGCSNRPSMLRLTGITGRSGSTGLAYAGVAVVEASALDVSLATHDPLDAPPPASFEADLVPICLAVGLEIAVWVSDGQFVDMGTPESYRALKASAEWNETISSSTSPPSAACP